MNDLTVGCTKMTAIVRATVATTLACNFSTDGLQDDGCASMCPNLRLRATPILIPPPQSYTYAETPGSTYEWTVEEEVSPMGTGQAR